MIFLYGNHIIINYSFVSNPQNSNKNLRPEDIKTLRNNHHPKYPVRFIRSARKHLRLRSEIPTTSWTKPEKPTSSNKDESNPDRFHSKRMTANHNIGFKMPPHIDKSRSTGNVSVMVGNQLLLTCTIPNTGNESVSLTNIYDPMRITLNCYARFCIFY